MAAVLMKTVEFLLEACVWMAPSVSTPSRVLEYRVLVHVYTVYVHCTYSMGERRVVCFRFYAPTFWVLCPPFFVLFLCCFATANSIATNATQRNHPSKSTTEPTTAEPTTTANRPGPGEEAAGQ